MLEQRTQEKHLNLVALQHLVSLQLVFDLLIPGLAILLLLTNTATHLGGLYICPNRSESNFEGLAQEKTRAARCYGGVD